MALKPLRKVNDDVIEFYFNEVAEPGIVVVFSGNGGSGAFTDQSVGLVVVPNAAGGPSGTKPAGVLMEEVVDIDQTRYELNEQRIQEAIGGKVQLLRKGRICTNKVASGQTPTAGVDAYYTTAGEFTTSSTNSTKVGQYLGKKDNDGYVYVDITIV